MPADSAWGNRPIPRAVLLAFALLAFAVPARASVDDLLLQGSTPTRVRALLLAHALATSDTSERAEALRYAGMSFEREGHGDSAIACYQGAVRARGGPAERLALADMLLWRHGPDDLQMVLQLVAPLIVTARATIEGNDLADAQGRRAWALYLADHGDSALRLMRTSQHWLLHARNPLRRLWTYRMGVLELENGDVGISIDLLSALAVESRFQDQEVMRDLLAAALKARAQPTVESDMKLERLELDKNEQSGLDSLHARRASFTARDGFPLSGVIFAPAARSRALVILKPPEADVDAFDSLGVAMRRAGFALMVVDVRGSGSSVAPACPSPATWHGREVQMQTLVAGDVRPAFQALAKAARIDTTRYLVGGVGPTAPIALEAAGLDPRARLVLLISPDPSPVERGIMRARIGRLGRPIFYHIPSDDPQTHDLSEVFYEAGDQRASRISESDLVGHGPKSFRHDTTVAPRLTRWIGDEWNYLPPRATRPTPRR